MNKLKLTILFVGFLSFTKPIFAQQTEYTLDLDKSIELALKENRNILNAKNDVAIAKKKIWEATATGLPQLKTELNYQNMIDVPVNLLPAILVNPAAGPNDYIPVKFGQQNSASFNFSASQLIFSGEYIVALEASKTYKELYDKAALKSEKDVVELVTQSYYGVLLAQANQKILVNTETDIQKTFDDIKQVQQAGMTDETDVDQIELNLITVKNAISSAERQITIAENILKYQIGIDVNSKITITDSIKGIFDKTSFKSVIDQNFDISKNIDYQMLQTQKTAQELNLKREKSTFLPTVSAFYKHAVTGSTNNFDDYFNGNQLYFQSNIVGAGLTWNIFNSGSKYVKVQEAQLEVEKMKNQDYILQQGLTFQVEQAKSALITAYENYLKEEKNTLLSEKIYRRGLVKFQNGLISSNELTQLNLQYFNNQSAYYNSMTDVLNNKVKLDKILGNNL